MSECVNKAKNLERCTCSSDGCPRKGTCCECLHAHWAKKQLPGCLFPPEIEKTWDRSLAKFIEVWSKRPNG